MSPSDFIDDQVQGRRRTLRLGAISLPWPFPVAYGVHGSSAMVFGWPVFGTEPPAYVRYAHNVFRKLSDAKYWLYYRLRPSYRYHVVNTGLGPGYHDCNSIMLHGAMALLCSHIEAEGGVEKLEGFTKELMEPGSEGHGPREAVERQASIQSEMLDIYRWWKVQKPIDEQRRDALMMELYSGRDRVSFVPVDGSKLSQMIFKEFEGSEVAMNEEFRTLEKKIEDDEQSMLHRLIDIRRSLWT